MPKEINEFCDLNDLPVAPVLGQFVVTFNIIHSLLVVTLQFTPEYNFSAL